LEPGLLHAGPFNRLNPDEPDGDDSNACIGPRDEYGNLQSFTTPEPIAESITIFEGQAVPNLSADGYNIKWYIGESSNELYDERNNRTYKTVTIGKQVWMAENLDIGTQIDGSVESSDNGIIEKYYFNNDPEIGSVYGGLYQWEELMAYTFEEGSQGVCPSGWHIPSNDEWKELELTLD